MGPLLHGDLFDNMHGPLCRNFSLARSHHVNGFSIDNKLGLFASRNCHRRNCGGHFRVGKGLACCRPSVNVGLVGCNFGISFLSGGCKSFFV